MDAISLDSPIKQSPTRSGFTESRTSVVPCDDSSRSLGREADSLSLRRPESRSQLALGSESAQSILRHDRLKTAQSEYRERRLSRGPYSYSMSTAEPSTEKGVRRWARLLKRGAPTCDLDVPLEPWRKALITFALAAAGFLVGLDQSIVEPALPTIVAQFHALHDMGAYGSAYLLPQCVLHPTCNKLYSMYSFSSVYISSILIFVAGCIVSALAQSSPQLICGRTISGIGAVGLSLGGFRLLALLPESKKQNLSMGAFSLILGSSIVVGPIMGGAITQSLGWEWIFWINLPVLALVLICVLVAMLAGGPDLRGQKYDLPFIEKLKSLDWLGTSLLILTLTPFILGIQLGQTDNWSGARFPAMFAVSGVSLILLIVQQTRAPEPIFDRKIMLNRSVWSTAGLFLSALSCVAVLILFLPFLLQKVNGVSPRTSGFLTFPLAGTLALGTFIFSIVSTMVPYFNPFGLVGCAMLLVAATLFVNLTRFFSIPQIVGYEAIAGFGVGMSWLSEIIYPRAALDKHQLATSLGYTRMIQQVGAAVAVQMATAIFTHSLRKELMGLPLTADELQAILSGQRAMTLPLSPVAQLGVVIAFSKAIRTGLILANVWAALAFLFSTVLPWPRLKGGITDRESLPNKGQVREVNSTNPLTDDLPTAESGASSAVTINMEPQKPASTLDG